MTRLSFIPPENRALVEKLSKKRVTNIKFDGKTCTFTYDGHRLKHHVHEVRHLVWVGRWSMHGDWRTSKKTLYYDNQVKIEGTGKELILVLVHEGVERYCQKRYNLSWVVEGHYVASEVEHALAHKLGVNWTEYQWKVEFINRKENEYKMRMARKNGKKLQGVGIEKSSISLM